MSEQENTFLIREGIAQKILQVLERKDCINKNELSERIHSPYFNVNENIKILIEKNLVKEDINNRFKKVYSITPRGKEVILVLKRIIKEVKLNEN